MACCSLLGDDIAICDKLVTAALRVPFGKSLAIFSSGWPAGDCARAKIAAGGDRFDCCDGGADHACL